MGGLTEASSQGSGWAAETPALTLVMPHLQTLPQIHHPEWLECLAQSSRLNSTLPLPGVSPGPLAAPLGNPGLL